MHLNVRFVLFTIWFATLSQAENYYLFFVDRAECIWFHTTNILLAIIIIIAISSIKHCRFAVSFSLWAVTYDIVKYFHQQKIVVFFCRSKWFFRRGPTRSFSCTCVVYENTNKMRWMGTITIFARWRCSKFSMLYLFCLFGFIFPVFVFIQYVKSQWNCQQTFFLLENCADFTCSKKLCRFSLTKIGIILIILTKLSFFELAICWFYEVNIFK